MQPAVLPPTIYACDLQGDINSSPVTCLCSVTLQLILKVVVLYCIVLYCIFSWSLYIIYKFNWLIFPDSLQIQLIFADHLHIQLIFADHLQIQLADLCRSFANSADLCRSLAAVCQESPNFTENLCRFLFPALLLSWFMDKLVKYWVTVRVSISQLNTFQRECQLPAEVVPTCRVAMITSYHAWSAQVPCWPKRSQFPSSSIGDKLNEILNL